MMCGASRPRVSCSTRPALLQLLPLSQHKEYFDFNFLGLMAHLLGKNLIYGLNIRVHFSLMAAGIESLVARFALLGMKKCTTFSAHLLLLSF
jgi:hypothetical protein